MSFYICVYVTLCMSVCAYVTFLRSSKTAKHTPSVPVIYRLAIDILESELRGSALTCQHATHVGSASRRTRISMKHTHVEASCSKHIDKEENHHNLSM